MKIKSMTATFGGLERARLEPGEGLTLVTAPNEKGKSTWAAFWRAMLYGIDTRDRDKKGHLADKNRFQPWSGLPMEGELALEWEGRDITLRRGPRGSTPFGSFSAVYTGTEEPVVGLSAADCGELLTGVGQEVFTRSAFLGAGGLAVTSAPELERRIAALVSSGVEDVSFSQVQDRLRDWQNKRRVNRSVGEIPRLERELALAEEALAQLEEVTGEISRLEEERTGLERRREELSRRQQAHQRYARQELSRRYVQAREEYEAARAQLDGLERELGRFGALPGREELKQAQGELQYIKVLDEEIKRAQTAREEAEQAAARTREGAKDPLFPDMTGEEALTRAGEEAAAYQAGMDRAGRLKKRSVPLLLLGLVLLGGLTALDFVQNGGAALYTWLGVGCCAVLAALSLLSRVKSGRAQRQADELLAGYGAGSPEALVALAQDFQKRCLQAEEAQRQLESVSAALEEQRQRREASRQQLLDFVHQFAPEVRDLFGCSAALSRSLNLEHELTLARERVEQRRRRLDDLAAQGGQEAEAGEDLPAPEGTLEETRRALVLVQRELEGVNAQLNQAWGRQRAVGDPAALAARGEELEGALARRRLEYAALELASEVLTQANTRLQERFSPGLNKLTGEYMGRLTGGRYRAVSLSRELEGSLQTGADLLPRSALYLSRGTVDQLYFALRLAVCRLCLPERPPIFLDDALAAFDDERAALALELLLELAREQQIILFTCHGREERLLAGRPEVTRLTL